MKARSFSHSGITVSNFNRAVRFYWDVFGCPLKVGLTHISFNVRNLQKWYDFLQSKGVECVSRPERSPRGHSFFFAKDFDGNLIELMDLGRMYYVLNWLGPLGGWLFRRGMYRKYYES